MNKTKLKKYSILLLLLSLLLATCFAIFILLTRYAIRFSLPSVTIYERGIHPKPSTIPNYSLLDTKDWNTFTSKSGEISLLHPPGTTIREGDEEFWLFLVDPDTNKLSDYSIDVSTYKSNEYNRPPEEFFTKENFVFDITNAQKTVVNGHPTLLRYDQSSTHATILVNETQYTVTLKASNHDILYPDVNPYLSEYVTLLNSLTITPVEFQSKFKIIDGNIHIRKNGRLRQLTNSGYDSNPVASPDGKKIAYLSEAETIGKVCSENIGYSCSSVQVFDIFLVDSNGKNKKKLTESNILIDHEILKWLDSDRLLYRDGDISIKTYTVSTDTHATLLGPEEAISECFNSRCQHQYTYDWSLNGRFFSVSRGGDKNMRTALIVDLETLESTNLDESNSFIYCSQYDHKNTVVDFTCDNSPPWVDGSKREYPVKDLTTFRYEMISKKMNQNPIKPQYPPDTL